MSETDIFVAAKNATVFIGGRRVKITRDVTRVRAGHPLLDGREALFKPLNVHHDLAEQPIEQATAAPGEQRATVRPDKAELLAQAEALGVEVDRSWGVKRIRAAIAEAESGA